MWKIFVKCKLTEISHESTYRRLKTYACSLCGNRFPDKGHEKTHIPKEQRPTVPCKECGINFESYHSDSCDLTVHKNKFKCNVCDKAFSSKSYLESIHLNAREYPCSLCFQKFFTRAIIKVFTKR